jgi:dynein light chain LC8-type
VDRKPMGAGSPPPAVATTAAVHKIQLKSADMKEEMRQEAFEIAGVVRALCRHFRSSIYLPALDLVFVAPPLLTGCSLGFGDFFSLSIPSLSVGQAFEKHSMEKNIAEYIKEFDKNHGPT